MDDGEVQPLSGLAREVSHTQERGTQIMNPLRLLDDMRELLVGMEDPEEIRKYSESRLSKNQSISKLISIK